MRSLHRVVFQSTPPARGATFPISFAKTLDGISIHAPREGGDCPVSGHLCNGGISIHAPREGGDPAKRSSLAVSTLFQSTPPARGATVSSADFDFVFPNFNPRPPRGGRRRSARLCPWERHFNPRHPRGGRRSWSLWFFSSSVLFQSTPPARGATAALHKVGIFRGIISIHAPREGGDFMGWG